MKFHILLNMCIHHYHLGNNLFHIFYKVSLHHYIHYRNAYLKYINGTPIQGLPLTFNVNNNLYTYDTDSNGCAGLKISLSVGSHGITVSFDGNDYYNAVSQTINVMVLIPTSIVIGNSILLTNGFLRVYLRSDTQSVLANQLIKITINGKVYNYTAEEAKYLVIDGGKGNDQIRADYDVTQNLNIFGGAGDDTIEGSQGNDLIYGGAGDDHIFGYEGNDTINGGAGEDWLFGDVGNDMIDGGDGDDHLLGMTTLKADSATIL